MHVLECNNFGNQNGFSMIEVIIALFLTMVGILGLMAMFPSGWNLASRSDQIGRTSALLHEEFQNIESLIANPCNNVVSAGARTVRASGQGSNQSGDMLFTMTPTITHIAGTDPRSFHVVMTVTVQGVARGTREALIVTRQDSLRFPAGCADGSVNRIY